MNLKSSGKIILFYYYFLLDKQRDILSTVVGSFPMGSSSYFKYFPKTEYAHQFLKGKVFHQTAAYFRDYEDKEAQQIIGDEYEGTRLFRPPDGLEIHNQTQRTKFLLNRGFESVIKANQIFVFCVSMSFEKRLQEEFGAVVCVEIRRPVQLYHRWLSALPKEARAKGKHVARRVRYYSPENVPGNVWALPDLITTTKLARFEYQNEYRFAFTTTDAFGFENCTYQLVDRKARPLPKPEEHRQLTLDLGDLNDICRLHEF